MEPESMTTDITFSTLKYPKKIPPINSAWWGEFFGSEKF
jgi:hypothetical protein